jgi:nicotinamidase-related amidase
MTVEALGPAMLELTTELQMLAPPAEIIDKHVYSPWLETDLHGRLARRGTTALVVTGGETDVCVLATVLGAIDFGYRVVIVTDALCSSSDETHEALLALYRSRFSQQIETASTEEVLDGWLAP